MAIIGAGGTGLFVDAWGRVGSDWNGTSYVVWSYARVTQDAPTALPSSTATSTSTGVNPTETSYALYGHPIPISVLGRGRIGGEIISGPWVSGGLASFCISFGFPADPSGTRDIREIAFDSEVVWDTAGASGVTTAAGGTFRVEPFTFRFYQGTLSQGADAIETAHFGADAVAYRPQMLLWFENLPIANTKFGKIPYVSAVLGDGTGVAVNLGEAFERLAASPFCDFPDFETVGITDGVSDGGLILAQDYELLQLIQQFGRFYPWDILQTDKLRISDRGSNLTPDIFLDKSNLIGTPSVVRSEPNSVASKLSLGTIDPDADYTIIESAAQRPRAPVAVTTSVKTESAFLPIIMDAATRTAIVTYTKYREETARQKIGFRVMAYGLEIEPGDLVQIDLGEDFRGEVYRIIETTHGADYTVECVGEAVMRCDLGAGCDEYEAFIARTSGLSVARKDAYRSLICGLVTDGVWDKLDVLHIYATEDSATALLNLKSTSYNGTANNSPAFEVDRGFTGGDDLSTFIETGFSPFAGGYTLNSAHVSVWSVTDVGTSAKFAIGAKDAAGIFWLTGIYPRNTDGKFYAAVNANPLAAVANVTNASPVGHFIANRPDAVNVEGYKDGALVATQANAPTNNPNNEIYTLALDVGASPVGSPHQLAMASIGAGLTGTDATNFYNRLRTYMTTVGVP